MSDRDDRGRRGDDEEGLSNLAAAYRKAGPYLGASTQLVVSMGAFIALGWWGDQKLGHETPWLLLIGAGVGMTVGFVSFFRTVLGRKDR